MSISKLSGTQLVGRDGEGIGAVERVFNKNSTDEPAWVTVRMGVMRREHILPLEGSQMESGSIRVPYTQEMVKNSPKLEVEHVLGAEDINALSQYYGTTAHAADAQSASGESTSAGAGGDGAAGAGAAAGARTGAGTGAADASHDVKVPQDLHRDATLEAVRYGERLQVAKESREAGRVNLRTYVEQVAAEQRIELHHETFEVERVPITDTAKLSREQPDWAEQAQEIVLFAEKAHVSKEVVPLERIIVRKKVVTEEQIVRDSLRTQQFDLAERTADAANAERSSTRDTADAAAARGSSARPDQR